MDDCLACLVVLPRGCLVMRLLPLCGVSVCVLGSGGGRWVSTSNALAAHLWPILAHAWTKSRRAKRDGALCPLAVVINSRKPLGVPLNYCGNVVTMQPVSPPLPPHHLDLTQRALQVRHMTGQRQRRGWEGVWY